MSRFGDTAADGGGTRWLALMLDEVGHGMVLLDEHGQLLFANHAARIECESGHVLQRQGQSLVASRTEQQARLLEALAEGQLGRRRLLALGPPEQTLSVAVIPLQSGPWRATLLMMSKRQVCDPLTLQAFASCHRLTQAETRVLERLCQGDHPREVARLLGVGLATVRSQIGSMRAKTGASSIRGLLRQVSVLPPLVSSLRATTEPPARWPGPA